jgi:hypothetical protein
LDGFRSFQQEEALPEWQTFSSLNRHSRRFFELCVKGILWEFYHNMLVLFEYLLAGMHSLFAGEVTAVFSDDLARIDRLS